MATIYRAANDATITPGMSFAQSRETAECYLAGANQGYGGSTLFAAEIDLDTLSILDLTGDRGFRRLSQVVGEDLAEDTAGDYSGNTLDQAVPCSRRLREALEAEGYDAILVDESFPEGTITLQVLAGAVDRIAAAMVRIED